jgi:Flp pilus assembly pilin Flp
MLSVFWRDEGGQDMIEYALLLAMVAVVAAVVIPPLGPSVSHIFTKAISVLQRFGA